MVQRFPPARRSDKLALKERKDASWLKRQKQVVVDGAKNHPIATRMGGSAAGGASLFYVLHEFLASNLPFLASEVLGGAALGLVISLVWGGGRRLVKGKTLTPLEEMAASARSLKQRTNNLEAELKTRLLREIELEEKLQLAAETAQAQAEETEDLRAVFTWLRANPGSTKRYIPVASRELERGGMGTPRVYYDRQLNRFVVRKHIRLDCLYIPTYVLKNPDDGIGPNYYQLVRDFLQRADADNSSGSEPEYWQFRPNITCRENIVISGNQRAQKILRDRWDIIQETKARFTNEAHIGQLVESDNVVKGYEPEGSCIITDFVRGWNLRADLSNSGGRFTLRKSLVVLQQIAQALRDVQVALDSQSTGECLTWAHRDLKPENVLRVAGKGVEDKDMIKLLDFGLARLPEGVGDESIIFGRIFGTPGYLAPELIERLLLKEEGVVRGDEATDVWALGLMLFEMCMGKLPFSAMPFSSKPTEYLRNEEYRQFAATLKTNARPKIASANTMIKIPDSIQKLFEDLVHPDPKQRPGLEDIIDRVGLILVSDLVA